MSVGSKRSFRFTKQLRHQPFDRHHFIRSGRFKSFVNQTETLIRYAQNKRNFSPGKKVPHVKVIHMNSDATTMADEKAQAVGLIRLNTIRRTQLTTLFAT